MHISGLNLRKLERSPTHTIIEEKPPGDYVLIPLKDGFGSSLTPRVKAGDRVEVGQVIARDDDLISTPIHSSVSGTVSDVSFIDYVHEETLAELPDRITGVRVEVGSPSQAPEGAEEKVNWEKLTPSEIRGALYRNGVTAYGQTGIPSSHLSSFFGPSEVSNIIVNAVKSEPFTSHRVDFERETAEFERGLEILARGYPEAAVHLAVDDEAQKNLGGQSSSQRIGVHSISSEHPNGVSEILAQRILGTDELDSGGYMMDHGILAIDEVVPLYAYRAVVFDRPTSKTRVSVGGPDVADVVFEVPVGFPIEEIVDEVRGHDPEVEVILGGPVTGRKMGSLEMPAGRTVSSLVFMKGPEKSEVLSWIKPGLRKESFSGAFLSTLFPSLTREVDSGLHGELRPCISCGYCSDVCPVDILPYQIYHTHTHEIVDEVNRLQPQRCVDCGLCSYVCPSKLPLSKVMGEAKRDQSTGVNNYVKYEKNKERLAPSRPEELSDNRGEVS
ncbi:4Fe-4S dicluster domain-containing protein [Candidatus Bipolaricaulota bacterium]|nr:4Fe-4S dicluster domain-containing protein [Candidatus Bipolaricaulota bacterium]